MLDWVLLTLWLDGLCDWSIRLLLFFKVEKIFHSRQGAMIPKRKSSHGEKDTPGIDLIRG